MNFYLHEIDCTCADCNPVSCPICYGPHETCERLLAPGEVNKRPETPPEAPAQTKRTEDEMGLNRICPYRGPVGCGLIYEDKTVQVRHEGCPRCGQPTRPLQPGELARLGPLVSIQVNQLAGILQRDILAAQNLETYERPSSRPGGRVK